MSSTVSIEDDSVLLINEIDEMLNNVNVAKGETAIPQLDKPKLPPVKEVTPIMTVRERITTRTTITDLVMFLFTCMIPFVVVSFFYSLKHDNVYMLNILLIAILFVYYLNYYYTGVLRDVECVEKKMIIDMIMSSVYFDMFVLLWMMTFLYRIIGYSQESLMTCLMVGGLHIFCSLSLYYLESKYIWVVHLLLVMYFPVNDPLFLTLGGAIQRLILSNIIMVLDVGIARHICKQPWGDLMMLNVVLPIWKTPLALTYAYFIFYMSYRMYTLRKHSVLIRESSKRIYPFLIRVFLTRIYTYRPIVEKNMEEEEELTEEEREEEVHSPSPVPIAAPLPPPSPEPLKPSVSSRIKRVSWKDDILVAQNLQAEGSFDVTKRIVVQQQKTPERNLILPVPKPPTGPNILNAKDYFNVGSDR